MDLFRRLHCNGDLYCNKYVTVSKFIFCDFKLRRIIIITISQNKHSRRASTVQGSLLNFADELSDFK